MALSTQDEMESVPRPGSFALVQLIHEALRRDLDRLTTAVRAPAVTPWRAGKLGEHWQFVRRQIRRHHEVEDLCLWPMARWRLRDRPDQAVVLSEMETQHAYLEPCCDEVDAAFRLFSNFPGRASADDLSQRLESLRADLCSHLDDEERHCFPVLDRALSAQDFELFGRTLAKSVGVRESVHFLPWVLDGAGSDEREAVMAVVGRPARTLCTLSWEPRYRHQATTLWGQQ